MNPSSLPFRRSLLLGFSRMLFGLVALVAAAAATPAAAQMDEGEPLEGDAFVSGVTAGGGLSFYQGDLDTNPENNYLKFLGSSRLSLFVRAEHDYERYRFGAELGYDRIGGERQFGDRTPYSFSNNALSLDLTASADLGFLEPGLFRAFLGAGPTFFVAPNFEGFPAEGEAISPDEEFREDGASVQANFMGGLNIQDAVRFGIRGFSSDYVDGFSGVSGEFDLLFFFNVTYRFGLTE